MLAVASYFPPFSQTLLRYAVSFTAAWFLSRLLLSFVFERLLSGKISIKHVGWASLNGVEWSLTKHTRAATSTRLQSIHIDRVGLVIRNHNAKDQGNHRLGWIGLAASGVKARVTLNAVRELHNRDAEKFDNNLNDVKDTMTRDPVTEQMHPLPAYKRLAWSCLAAIAFTHELRRSLRRFIIRSTPQQYARHLSRISRNFRRRVVAPMLSHINTLARLCNKLFNFIAFEITDTTIEIAQIQAEFKLDLLRVGVEISRGRKSCLGAWIRAEGAALSILPPQNLTKGQKDIYSSEQAESNRAFELPGAVLFEAEAFFDPAIGMAGLYHRTIAGRIEPRKTILDVSIAFCGPKRSVEEKNSATPSLSFCAEPLVQLLDRIRAISKIWTYPHSSQGSGLQASSLSKSNLSEGQIGASGSPLASTGQNPLAMLKSIRIGIPLIRVKTGMPLTSISDEKRRYSLEINWRGCALECAVGGKISKEDKHSEWFGRDAELKGTARLGFEKLDFDIIAAWERGAPMSTFSAFSNELIFRNNTEAGSVKPTRVLEVSPSGLHATSSWLPKRLDALLALDTTNTFITATESRKSIPFAEDRSTNRIIFEGDLGGIHGEAGIDFLGEFLRNLPSRRPLANGTKTNQVELDAPRPPQSEILIYDPPIVVLAVEVGRCEYRIAGPKIAHKTMFGPGEDDANLSVGWEAPSIVCLHLPSASVHVSSQYIDVTIKRTEAQRKELKRQLKRGKVSIPEILQEKSGDTLQRPSGSYQRESRRRLFDLNEQGNDSEQNDSETVSGSMSPTGSPGVQNFSQKGLSDLQESTFVTPADTGSSAHNSPVQALNRASEEDLRSHSFVYQSDMHLLVDKIEVFLLSAHKLHDQQSAHTNSTLAGNSSQDSSRAPAGQARRPSRPKFQARHDIFYLGPFGITSDFEFVGREMHDLGQFGEDTFSMLLDIKRKSGNIRFQVESIGGDVSRLDVHHALNGLAVVISDSLLARGHRAIDVDKAQHTEGALPSVNYEEAKVKQYVDLMPSDLFLILSLNKINFLLAGPDPKFSPGTCRGLAFQAQNVTLEAFQQSRAVSGLFTPHIRASLALKEDIRSHANQQFVTVPHVQQAYFRFYLNRTSVNPMKDAGQEGKVMRAKTVVDQSGQETTGSEIVWELKNRDKLSQKASSGLEQGNTRHRTGQASQASVRDFFWLPYLTIRFSLWAEMDQSDAAGSGSGDKGTMVDHIGITMDAPTLIARVEVFPIYCFLLALSASGSLRPGRSSTPHYSQSAMDSRNGRRPPIFTLRADVPEVHIYLTLPQDVRLFARIRRIRMWNQSNSTDITVKFDTALIAGASIAAPGLWDDLIRMREISITAKSEFGSNGHHNIALYAQGSGARLRLPFKFPFSIIIDNAATFVKTIRQLLHQFLGGKFNSAIEPHAEGPKHLPKIRIGLKIFTIEAQDDPFETKLNLIWRAGVEEQAERLSRERAFTDKVEAIRTAEDEIGGFANLGNGGSDGRDEASQGWSGKPSVSIEKAHALLQEINSTKWIKRHKNAMATRARREEAQMRRLYGGLVPQMNDSDLPIPLVSTAGTAPLFRMALENQVIEITKPTFSKSPTGLVDFLSEVGKGQPKDSRYSLLIPFHLTWQMSEARVHLRDYPLPLIYIPPLQLPQSEAKSWQMTTDFVIAEELGGPDAIRHVPCVIVPRSLAAGTAMMPYVLRVPRTAMPVKSFALPVINITSTWATRIGWGNSIQPTIQDVMRVIDTLTKAPPDPSERMGFWDKLRLILHWRISINFLGEGPLHFILKGSRDPYNLQGEGAGFALCWSGNIRWTMGFPNEDREFLQIHSDNFVLGIPGE